MSIEPVISRPWVEFICYIFDEKETKKNAENFLRKYLTEYNLSFFGITKQ